MNELEIVKNIFHGLRGVELIDKIYEVEARLLASSDPNKIMPDDLKTVHYFEDGLYARELHVPKDAWIIGKMHKRGQIITISKGDMSILTDEGFIRVQAPFTVSSAAGAKRIGFAHEDTVVTTYSATELKDLSEIEKEIIISTYEQYLEYKKSEVLCLG